MPTKRPLLTRARKSAGLTQEDMAHRLGVDVSTVKRWEGGYNAPSPWMWPRLAKLLGLTRTELVAVLMEEPTAGAVEPRVPESIPTSLGGLRKAVLGGTPGETDEVLPFDTGVVTAHRLYQSADYDGASRLLQASE